MWDWRIFFDEGEIYWGCGWGIVLLLVVWEVCVRGGVGVSSCSVGFGWLLTSCWALLLGIWWRGFPIEEIHWCWYVVWVYYRLLGGSRRS